MDSEHISTPSRSWGTSQLDISKNPQVVACGQPAKTSVLDPDNFYRSARWCPDGNAILAQCEDRTLQVTKLNRDAFVLLSLYSRPTDPAENAITQLVPDSVFRQSGPVLDYIWYPGAGLRDLSTYCFVTSVRECPVKLIDATDGRLRASYRIVDHRERQIAPHSMAFNSVASHLYCGFEDAIEVFDVQRPGEGIRLATTPSKKSKDGMKGIVSSLAFCPDYSGVYAASSLSSAITLFSEVTGDEPVAYLDGASTSIMQVQFNPAQPHLLYASQRRSDQMLCWDIRSPHVVLHALERRARGTNQKLRFDVDPSGQWLTSGDEHGDISIFDLSSGASEPVLQFHAHDDAVGSTAFRPSSTSLLSVSGSRHFHSLSNTPSDSDTHSESDPNSDTDNLPRKITARRHPRRPFTTDTSMKLWDFFTGVINNVQIENAGRDDVARDSGS